MKLSRRAFALGLASVAACRTTRAPEEGDAQASRTATRVVSLGPATTEALFAIGAGGITVGRSRFCDTPPEARALPSVGGFTDPSIETILSLRPDLVVGIRGPGGAAIVGTLEARGVRTYFPETESKDQIVSLLRGLGERTGHEREAAALVSGIEAELAAVRNVVAKKPKRRALLVYGRAPLVVAGRGSFADEMLTLAGIENACASNEHYPTIDVERVLAWDPDDVLDASVGMGMDADDPSYFRTAGWRRVRAVTTGRVLKVTTMDVTRPGPSFARGVSALARLVHGPDGLPPG
ncbi:MAG: ABC transporter substrate-binding protein [Myxococcales bacterium]|nr:ABC transporter substrate-binding protein [Myxococcales bacterium]